MSHRKRHSISRVTGVGYTEDLSKYLGVLILHKKIGRSTCEDLVLKIKNKMNAWDARTLSLDGRITLAKSVLEAILSYTMQATNIPVLTCATIDKLIRNFIWAGKNVPRCSSRVAWKKVAVPKKAGGLGIHPMLVLNEA